MTKTQDKIQNRTREEIEQKLDALEQLLKNGEIEIEKLTQALEKTRETKAELQTQLEKLDSRATRWVPKDGENVYLTLGDGSIVEWKFNMKGVSSPKYLQNGTLFPTREAAEKQAKRDAAHRELTELSARLGPGYYKICSCSTDVFHQKLASLQYVPGFKDEDTAKEAWAQASDNLKKYIDGKL